MKKTIAIVLCLAVCLTLLASCGAKDDDNAAAPGADSNAAAPNNSSGAPASSSPNPAPASPSGITVEAEPPPETANLADHINFVGRESALNVLNPTLAGSTSEAAWLMRMTNDMLIDIWGPNDYRPSLATSWKTEDYKHILVTLRDDAYFHNGDHFTAEDVKFTVEVAWEHPGGTSYTIFRTVEAVNIIDPYTVEIVFVEPDVNYQYQLSHWSAGMLNKNEYEKRPDDPLWASIGTGPFKLVDFSPANFATVERNDDYWGEPAPTRSFTVWTIPEMATRNIMLQTGEIQVCFVLATDDLDAMLTNPDFSIIEDPVHYPLMLAFNNQGNALMMDMNFRLAVAHALNLEDIAVVSNGNWARAWPNGSLWGQRTPWFKDDLPRREYNPDLAKEYLAQSVYNGETVELVSVPDFRGRAAEMIQAQLGQIGIDIDLIITDTASYSEAFAYNPESTTQQLSVFNIGFGPTVLGSIRTLLAPGVVTNRFNMNSELINECEVRLAAGVTLDEEKEIAYAIQDYLWETIAAIPVCNTVLGITTVPGIGGMNLWGDPWSFDIRGIYWDLNQTPEHLKP